MSSRSKQSNVSRNRSIKLLLISFIVFIIGYYLLNDVATLENPPVGPIFHVILGCILMALSLLSVVILINKIFFKKKRSSSRQTFLKDQQKNSDIN